MEIAKNVHQIKIEFNVTPEIKRFVYVYLILGEKCYLIDTGVAGSEIQIAEYMKGLGRDISEIAGVFLTHAHPDHIGAAAAIKKSSECIIFAPEEEIKWIEDIKMQYEERPIPNFYQLVSESVKVDVCVQDDMVLSLGDGVALRVIKTPGHSFDSTSYLLDESILFCGDAIPAPNDIPIFVDYEASIKSMDRILRLKDIKLCCPAWDKVYSENEYKNRIDQSKEMLAKIYEEVKKNYIEKPDQPVSDSSMEVIKSLGMEKLMGNPLFQKSLDCCRERVKRESL